MFYSSSSSRHRSLSPWLFSTLAANFLTLLLALLPESQEQVQQGNLLIAGFRIFLPLSLLFYSTASLANHLLLRLLRANLSGIFSRGGRGGRILTTHERIRPLAFLRGGRRRRGAIGSKRILSEAVQDLVGLLLPNLILSLLFSIIIVLSRSDLAQEIPDLVHHSLGAALPSSSVNQFILSFSVFNQGPLLRIASDNADFLVVVNIRFSEVGPFLFVDRFLIFSSWASYSF